MLLPPAYRYDWKTLELFIGLDRISGMYKNCILLGNFNSEISNNYFNPIQDGLFRDCSRIGGGAFLPPLPKIRHTYPTAMKLGTVISYLRKIQKMYKSRDTSLEFCWHQHFFTGNQQTLLHQGIHI